jgi:hypothetical protein
MRIRLLEPYRQSLRSRRPTPRAPLGPAVAAIICYAPQVIRMRIPCFALPSEVSLYQADHVSSEEPACNTRAGSATPALPRNQACVRRTWCIPQVACVFSSVVPPSRPPEVVPVLEA